MPTKCTTKVWIAGDANNGCILNLDGYLGKEAGERCSCFKWYKYLFWFMVDVSVCWAFILFNHFQESRGGVIKIR